MAKAPYVNANMGYDLLRDFTPVSLIETSPFVLVANPELPTRSVSEFIALARSRPGTKCFDHDQAVRQRSVSLEQGNARDCAYRQIMGLTRLSPMRSAPQGTSHTRVCREA